MSPRIGYTPAVIPPGVGGRILCAGQEHARNAHAGISIWGWSTRSSAPRWCRPLSLPNCGARALRKEIPRILGTSRIRGLPFLAAGSGGPPPEAIAGFAPAHPAIRITPRVASHNLRRVLR